MLNLSMNWKNVIDSLHKGVVVIDADGAIRHVNPAFLDLTGYHATELLGKACSVLECSGCEPWHGHGDSWCMLFFSGEALRPVPCRIRNRVGKPLKVFRQASVIRDEAGKSVGAVETIWGRERVVLA